MSEHLTQDLTWFWAIVDRYGLADVPSDERGALAVMARHSRAHADLVKALEGEAEWLDGMSAYLTTTPLKELSKALAMRAGYTRAALEKARQP